MFKCPERLLLHSWCFFLLLNCSYEHKRGKNILDIIICCVETIASCQIDHYSSGKGRRPSVLVVLFVAAAMFLRYKCIPPLDASFTKSMSNENKSVFSSSSSF